MARSTGAIAIDGDLSDAGWRGATRIQDWYETSPGDNTRPPVSSTALLAYDDSFFYVGLELSDPFPDQIRAPLGDRDSVGDDADYAGVILDTRKDGKRAILLRANARGIQYDAIIDDATGTRDPSLDLYWDSRARITRDGWVLELRIPFASLRYEGAHPTWGIILLRNYPRAFRYQLHTAILPRGSNCLVCHAVELTGFADLPSSSHLVVAPSARLGHTSTVEPRGGATRVSSGVDVKWTPRAHTALDLTVNPDFSQIESDSLQITANERFAIFYPEKRTFFLEGSELFETPIKAVHTRTITSPRWGGRITGRGGNTAYSALVAEDEGGGSVIIPGPSETVFAPQDHRSLVGVARIRRDIGSSYVGGVATLREVHGGGYNRVCGPDFQWRHGDDRITGQLLLSQTSDATGATALDPGQTGGGKRTSAALDAWFARNSTAIDWYGSLTTIGRDFRADDGFVPQAGFRKLTGEVGYTFHPEGSIRSIRPSLLARRATDTGSLLLEREVSARVGLEARWNSRADVSFNVDRVRAKDVTVPRRQVRLVLSANPSGVVSELAATVVGGGEIDFDNARRGSGTSLALRVGLRPNAHLDLRLATERRWLYVDSTGLGSRRLFIADVARGRATYTFTERAFVRVIVERLETRRDPSMYMIEVPGRSGSLNASVLLSYKVNWQTLFFAGYGDERIVTERDEWRPTERHLFVKLSYSYQH